MRRGTWTLVAAACATLLGILIGCPAGAAQHVKRKKPSASPTPYNPYPPGILPADLQSELDRVEREIAFIFQQALAEFRALPPPNLTGQPPILQGSGYAMVRTVGKLMNYDLNISAGRNTACASCHMPYPAFAPPIPTVNLTTIAHPAALP